jgi:hypothetical protein
MPRRPIDTLHLVKRLQEAGFSPAQAEAQVEVLLELYALRETATKSDLKKLRILSKKDIAQTEARLQAEIRETEARLQAEIEKVRLELRETEARLQAEIRETEARLCSPSGRDSKTPDRPAKDRSAAQSRHRKAPLRGRSPPPGSGKTQNLPSELNTEKRLTLNIQETEKRLLLNIQETEARLRTDILRAQVRIVLWIAGLIAAQIPIFYLLRRFLLL